MNKNKKETKKATSLSKKSPQESSSLFHNIMKASVKGNPKPKHKQKK
jgi:hypothetical protein